MDSSQLNWISNYIWGIADDVLRDLYVRGKYRDVILPMTVLRRLDALLEPTKQAVLDMKKKLDKAKVTNQDAALRKESGQAFYNKSKFTLRDLRARASQQQLKADFEAYLDGFSSNVQDILENFEFRNQISRLSKADALGTLIEKLLSPDINLSPNPVLNGDGSVKHPGLDNHAMGTIFEELVRRFNEENNEEAGEHWTPRDAVKLMAQLIFLPIADEIESGTYLLYDGACGTGGMLTVAEDSLQQLAEDHGKEVATHLYGQEINAETYAICKADLLLKGDGEAADNIIGGPEHSTLSKDAFRSREFDFMLSNPPYGKSWKGDLERMSGKKDLKDQRFVIEHNGDPEFSLVTRSSDGQMLFLVNMLSKMKSLPEEGEEDDKRKSKLGSRIAEVHNGSSLFTGDAGQGESNIRRWIIENDWLEAIVALPLNMFYNTGIATYIWVLTNRKPDHRQGKIQLIDATEWFKPLRKNLGKKNCELSSEDIQRICDTFLAFEETNESKIFPSKAFGYWKVTVERPLRWRTEFTDEKVASLRFLTNEPDLRRKVYEKFGDDIYKSFSKVKKQITDLVSTLDPDLKAAAKNKILKADTWKDDLKRVERIQLLSEKLGLGPFLDFNKLLDQAKDVLDKADIKLSKAELEKILEACSERDENAEPVVAKVHKTGKAEVDEIHGRYASPVGDRKLVIEYESDSELRDTEQIPLLEEGGIEAFIRREVLPHATDAWYDEDSIKIGYEVSFNRYFYKPQPLRPLEEIRADILGLEKETEGLLDEILGVTSHG